MTPVVAFVITVDWLRCEANCQTLLGGDDIVMSEKRRVTEFKQHILELFFLYISRSILS